VRAPDARNVVSNDENIVAIYAELWQ
jgi:hypothetical protein